MVKSSQRILTRPLLYPLRGTLAKDRTVYAERLEGTYGKRWKRLNNGYKMAYFKRTGVVHSQELVLGNPHIMWDYPGWGSSTYVLEPSVDRGNQILNHFEPILSKVEYRLLNSIYRRLEPVDLSFNLFSFIYELRELPSLLDPLKVSLKRLMRPGDKKTLKSTLGNKRWKREVIDDVASTFVNGQFGLVPTIQDSKEIMSRLGDLENSYSKLKALTKQKRRYGYSEDVELPSTSDYGRLCSPAVIGNAFTGSSYSIVFTKARCTVNGVATYDIPFLNTLGFSSAVLDRSGFHLDLATLWNAIPFSWLVDWIVPIGDALAADRQPWTEINILNDGTLSWKIEYSIIFENDKVQSLDWSGRQPNYSSSGVIKGSIYWRYKIPPIREYRYPPFEILKGWNLRKAAIGSAVANGFRKK